MGRGKAGEVRDGADPADPGRIHPFPVAAAHGDDSGEEALGGGRTAAGEQSEAATPTGERPFAMRGTSRSSSEKSVVWFMPGNSGCPASLSYRFCR